MSSKFFWAIMMNTYNMSGIFFEQCEKKGALLCVCSRGALCFSMIKLSGLSPLMRWVFINDPN
jgi:hypothetical protein